MMDGRLWRMLRPALRCGTRKYQKLQVISTLRTYAHASPRVISPGNTRIRVRKPDGQSPAFSNIPSWPIDVLRVACQSGAVKASLPKVHEFLKGIWSLAGDGSLSKSNTKELLSKHELDAKDLTMIARCLVTQRSDKRIISLGLDCLSLAADIGDNTAALYLVDLAVENKAEKSIGPVRYQKALSHIKRLAASQELSSMVLLAKTHEQLGNFREASRIYQEVVDIEVTRVQQGTPILEKERYPYAEAYRNLGRLLSQRPGSEDSALQCFERAALAYEDAASFYFMALAKGESHQDYITWMSQAAISGVTDATYELGLVYSKKGDAEGVAEKRADQSYLMAIHWFELAEESLELANRAKLHIERIRRVQNGPETKVPRGLIGVAGKEYEDLNPSLKQFLDAHWEDPVFSLTAGTLESKMEEFGNSVVK